MTKIPDYLTDPTLDYPYRLYNASGIEVPYVSSFSIARSLGGWTSQFVPPGKTPDDVDLIRYDAASNRWVANYDQFIAGLKPFLDAGYQPQDITIVLDNIPWDLSTNTCTDGSPVAGAWGNRSPVADYWQWESFITAFAGSLNAATGGRAGDFRYKLGIEYNSPESFCGSLTDYEQYYASTVAALGQVIASPKVMPYESGGGPTASSGGLDTTALYEWITSQHLPAVAVARSLNYFPYLKLRLPADVVQAGAESFQSIYAANPDLQSQALPEVDQSGTISAPNPATDTPAAFLDDGPSEASWDFQTMFRLIEQEPVVRVNHWNVLDQVPASSGEPFLLPTAESWLYQILDNLVGASIDVLPLTATPAQKDVEPYAVGFTENNTLTVLVSTYGMHIGQGAPQSVHVQIRPGVMPSPSGPYVLHNIPMAAANTPAYQIKRLLQHGRITGAGLAAPFFSSAHNSVGTIVFMAADTNGGPPSRAAAQKVGDMLKGNGPTARIPMATIRSMFMRKSYSSSYLMQNPDGSYTLDAGTFMAGDLKLFTIH